MRRFLIAFFSFALCLWAVPILFSLIPWDFHRASPVIGGPMHNGYDINRFFFLGYFSLLATPLVSWLLKEVLCRVWRCPPASSAPALERPLNPNATIAWWIGMPVVFWLLDAHWAEVPQLPGHDFFHWGEGMVPASLFSKGWIPWREFFFVHGLLEDVLQYWVGIAAFGKTLWSAWSGRTLFFHPLGLICSGSFYLLLFRSNPWFLLLTLTLTVFSPFTMGPNPSHFVPRFIFVPVCLSACLIFLRRPTVTRAYAFALVAVGNLFLCAETVFLCLGFGGVVVLADLQGQTWRRTRLFVSACAVWIVVGFSLLASLGALAPFIEFHLGTASGHRFSGGGFNQRIEPLWIWASLGALTAAIWRAIEAWRTRSRLTPEELTLGAVVVFNLLYYQKFLGRADSHHFQMVWLPCLSLGFYCAYRIANRLPRSVSQFLAVTALVLCVPQIWASLDLGRWRVPAKVSNVEPRLGPLVLSHRAESTVRLFHEFFAKNGGQQAVFDFTNQPLLFHWLLDMPPATRFPYVSLAIHPNLQKMAIKELQASDPKWVAYYVHEIPAFAWDGIENPVRHPLISQYLLSHYQPKQWVDKTLILERIGDHPSTFSWKQAVERMNPCDWGLVPAFWSENATVVDLSQEVRFSSLEGAVVFELPKAAVGRPGSLDLYFDQVGDDSFSLQLGEGVPPIQFRSRPAQNTRYRIEVASCPSWYAAEQGRAVLKHQSALRLRRVEWVASVD